MALDPMAQELVTETMTQLQAAAFKTDCDILISPRRMRAIILFSQQRMQLQIGQRRVTLIEDNDAPELSSAIEAALAVPELPELPEPVLPPIVQQHNKHKAVNGKNGRKHAR